jgi:hypothetical protein
MIRRFHDPTHPSFPLFEVRCPCGGIAHGFVPRGGVTSTIRATLAV